MGEGPARRPAVWEALAVSRAPSTDRGTHAGVNPVERLTGQEHGRETSPGCRPGCRPLPAT